MTFDKNKKYIFSRDKWLADTGNVLMYKHILDTKRVVDELDGEEITYITKNGKRGFVKSFLVFPEHCDLIKSKRKTTFRDAVNGLLLRDKQAQLHEVINMLVSDRKRLERRLGAINKELARREQELYEVDKELIEKWTSS